MTNLILLGNIISILASGHATSFSLVSNHVKSNEIALMEEPRLKLEMNTIHIWKIKNLHQIKILVVKAEKEILTI